MASWSNLRAYDFLYDFIFFIDLLFCTVGYAMSLRITDSHVRTAEPTMLGWVVALFCYPPFYNLFSRQYVPYDSAYVRQVARAAPGLRWAWAIVILALITIYVLATVAFGIRFSNLTHRGILTNGPYRFTKHPAYVSKNLSWWMASVPFLLTDGNPLTDSLKRCIALGVINFMYFMRAKTEERHLSRDPIYVEYATLDERPRRAPVPEPRAHLPLQAAGHAGARRRGRASSRTPARARRAPPSHRARSRPSGLLASPRQTLLAGEDAGVEVAVLRDAGEDGLGW
jgi:protein-S-isoprenylcysteine O-methyltransferase Ste14